MSRYFRWQLVLPRLLLVIVVLLGAQYALGLVARSLVVSSGEAAIGTSVELHHARVAPLDRHLVLGDLRVAHPFRPSDELLHVERCELDVAVRPLLNKQLVIEHGRVSGLRIGQQGEPHEAVRESAPASNWFHDAAEDSARQRLTALAVRFDPDVVDQFASIQRAEALHARLPTIAAAVDQRATAVRQRAMELQQMMEVAQANPLRNAAAFEALPDELAAVRSELDDVQAEIDELPQALHDERRAIAAALRQDAALLLERLRTDAIDEAELTAYLFRSQITESLDELFGWLRWFRQTSPANAGNPAPTAMIRALELHGETRLGSQAVPFRGLLTGLVVGPGRRSQPVRLRLVSTDALPFDLYATVDRTGGMPCGELLVHCRDLKLPEMTLGHAEHLRLTASPSVGALSISIRVVGDELFGDIQMVQQPLSVTATLGGALAHTPLAAPLHEALDQTNAIATRIDLHGTVNRPACTVWSSLGPAVAEAIDGALRHAAEGHARTILAEAQRRIEARMADVQRQLVEHQAGWASQLAAVTAEVETLAAAQSPHRRLSTERLGHNPPAGSLFR